MAQWEFVLTMAHPDDEEFNVTAPAAEAPYFPILRLGVLAYASDKWRTLTAPPWPCG
jgi:hypothetical protein